jgi:gamma-glutamylcyclotransferase (GGCT)/AIG2-like uncharacterized protein YtfP
MISSRIPRRDSLLFVYGTLRPFVDVPMARWLRRVARLQGGCRTRGRLYDLGPYPAIKPPRAPRDSVEGDLFRVTNSRILHVLDRYEAGGALRRPRFARERCVVRLARGGCREAWIYRYRFSVLGRTPIVGGDYRAHRHVADLSSAGAGRLC